MCGSIEENTTKHVARFEVLTAVRMTMFWTCDAM
jgi:hypothetical protein